MKIIDHFEIPYYQFLDESGKLVDDGAKISKNFEALRDLYRLMYLIRIMDSKAIALQRTGKLGTYPSTRGQEAVFVGVGHAMDKKDIYVPYYRDAGVLMQRGVKMSDILSYWGGDERGNCFPEGCEDLPFSVPIGSQPLHAVGVAYAEKYKKQNRAVVSMCGDGATSQGDFYEAMNVAGIWKLPVVFVVSNNQWAISVPRSKQTATHTIAQKAIAAGFGGEQLDGNDIIAVHERTQIALEKARKEQRPHLIEMVCYRQHDHTTADDASRYEPKGMRDDEWKKEPIMRLRHYLENAGKWSAKDQEGLDAECDREVEKTVEEYMSRSRQPLVSMIDYMYEKLPESYQEQRDIIAAMEVKNG